MSMNMFAVLGDDAETGAPMRREKSGKAASSAAQKKEKAPLSGFPGEQPANRENKHAARVPDRMKESHRGGASNRGAHRGGRGGAHADPTRRQFDRHGAPTKHAPNHAHRDGAALGPQGGAEPVKQGDATADVVEIAAETPVVEVVPDMDFQEVDPDEDLKTYDEYLASKKMVEDEVQVREVIISEEFNKVKPLKREDDEEESKEEASQPRASKKSSTQRSANKINLDEFRGGREADAQIRRPESARGGRGGFRGGRGGFVANGEQRGDAPAAAARGGRGGFVARGGRGGGAPRGGARGGFAPRAPRTGASAPVALNDKNAFPAL